MEKEILECLLKGNRLVTDIAEELNLSQEVVREILKKNYYYPYEHKSGLKFMYKLRDAVLYFISHEESATKVAKRFNITPTVFCLKLKFFGINVENKQNRTKFNENVFDSIDTEEKAYWLGYIFADGTISSHKSETKERFAFELCTCEKDRNHLEKFNSFIGYEGINIKEGKVKLGDKTFTRYRWVIGNRHLWEALNSLGCVPNKSLILKFPIIPENLKRHFIRGYFDGDGSIGIYNGKVQCSCIGTLDILNNILKDFMWTPHYHHDKRHSESTYSFQLTSEKAYEFLHYIYDDCNVYLNRKYNTFKCLPSIEEIL